ncbi:peptidoglycan/LPS O-acetylase OafA/YrhL [Agromyces sp. 3263]|uniref:acyltransferase family protein n=1 Tax=Agromyces sp. 3263 TaxID=2817750 RepID=UPI002855BE8A|nr:acyltransferase family protein [Agromyces sp. 3263]MDR6904645.1 peptidoglycan/LPS O-acetylase OafA/YrhL [Agromyces sp. 3263]
MQGLRALAVALVVLYHLWPARLPGGYIGVDVFFVISGFLITAHLVRDVERTGRVALSTFWARRIRRLLPAAFTVLAASCVFTLLVSPPSVVEDSLRQIGAASAYVLNWLLATESIDYLDAANRPTLVQHFWTLSVEEQFYIVMPLLIAVVLTLVKVASGRRGTAPSARTRRRWISISLVGVFGASLTYSVIATAVAQPFAFFDTFARAWEFAAGGLLAMFAAAAPHLLSRLRRTRLVSSGALGWAGIGVIIGGALLLNGGSPFPGWVAMFPVLGALAVISAGNPSGRRAPGRVLGLRAVQSVGDLSYGIYLWHWPLIIAFPVMFARSYSTAESVGIVGAAIVLAIATKYLIEDPFRYWRGFVQHRRVAFAFAAAGTALFIMVATVQVSAIEERRDNAAAVAEQMLATQAECFGANAMLGGRDCPDRLALPPGTDLAFAAHDLDPDWCLTGLAEAWRTCEYGDPAGTAGHLALVGDSHAAALIDAFDEYFRQVGWRVTTFVRFGCPGLSESPVEIGSRTPIEEQACADWSARVTDELVSSESIDAVVYTSFTSGYAEDGVPEASQLHASDIEATWSRVMDSGKTVVAVRDIPRTSRVNIPNCLEASTVRSAPCAIPKASGFVDDPQTQALKALGGRVPLVDLTDAYCDESTCYTVIGGVVVYADDNHVSHTYAMSLAPFLGARVESALPR